MLNRPSDWRPGWAPGAKVEPAPPQAKVKTAPPQAIVAKAKPTGPALVDAEAETEAPAMEEAEAELDSSEGDLEVEVVPLPPPKARLPADIAAPRGASAAHEVEAPLSPPQAQLPADSMAPIGLPATVVSAADTAPGAPPDGQAARAEVLVPSVPTGEEDKSRKAAALKAPASSVPKSEEEKYRKAAALKLFKYVSGVLNGAYPVELARDCADEIAYWLSEEASSDQASVGASARPTFAKASDALAVAIRASVVPQQGISVLVGLTDKLSARGIQRGASNLLQALRPFMCPATAGNTTDDLGTPPGGQAPECKAQTSADVAAPAVAASAADTAPRAPPSPMKSKQPPAVAAGPAETSEADAEMTEVPQQPPAVAASPAATCNVATPAVAASHAEARKAAAHKLFKYVSGVLNDAHGVDQVQDCMDAIGEWLSKAEIKNKFPASATSWFAVACDALAAAITEKAVPPKGVAVLATLAGKLSLRGIKSNNSSLLPALKPVLCPACGEQPPVSANCVRCRGSGRLQCTSCSGSGRFKPECRSCGGTGRRGGTCWTCGGAGKKDVGPCHSCDGSGTLGKCSDCETQPEVGCPRPFCAECAEERRASQVAAKGTGKGTGKGKGRAPQAPRGPPPKGVTIERCTASQLSDLQRLWEERQGRNRVLEAWKVDNPLLSYKFMERYKSLKQELGRNPDELQGFHGTHPSCVVSICEGGFDAGRRAGQVYGAGEYFAKCPTVSEGYCKGGQYMLVCRLSLGIQSSTQENFDGDHIWVPRMGYYVISSPEQVLPLYILRFEASYRYNDVVDPKLTDVLSRRSWTTKPPEPIIRVPPNRQCFMSRPTTDVLWMGLLHAHIPDEQIEDDVRSFLARYAPQHTAGLKVHVIKGKFKKAHAILTVPIPKDLVHRLNTATYVEGGKERRQICVED